MEASGPPADAMEGIGRRIAGDAADMVFPPEDLMDLHCFGMDFIDDGLAVGAVFCCGDPDMGAVEIDSAEMIDAAFSDGELGQQFAGGVDPEQVSRSLASVETPVGRYVDFYGGDPEVLSDFYHSLAMEGLEGDFDFFDEVPGGGFVDRFQPSAQGAFFGAGCGLVPGCGLGRCFGGGLRRGCRFVLECSRGCREE